MSQTLAMNSGIMTVPRIATSQLICLNFDGGLTSYNGELFSIEQVEVGNAGLSEHQIAQIVAKLNAEFEGQNVVFTADMPASGEYSTVFIGKTSAFEPFGTFAGIAETIDSGNKNKNDKAFVILKGGETTDEIANIISHETGHLLGTFDHGGGCTLRLHNFYHRPRRDVQQFNREWGSDAGGFWIRHRRNRKRRGPEPGFRNTLYRIRRIR